MAENRESGALPPGWDRKYDHRTGRYYYINYFNKTTTWEDPRIRYRQLAQPTPQHVQTSVAETIPLQDLTNVRPSPIPGRAVGHPVNPYASPARTTETSMTTDTEQSVVKISAMFPTVSDTHIRALLMKYLKSVFPKVEETLLLDILSNSDNNVQKATEKLIAMGFEKRDTPPPRLTLRKKEEEPQTVTQEHRAAMPTPPPRMKSAEEKQKMKARLQENYPDIPERVITIALESVDFDVDRASQILNIMVQEEEKKQTSEPTSIRETQPEEAHPSPQLAVELDTVQGPSPIHKPATGKASEKTERGQHRRSKGKKDVPKVSRGTSTTEDKEYKSPYLMKVCGPNRELYKGPNDDLLLIDYVTWNGPNVDLLGNGGRMSLAKGPNKSLLQGDRSYIPKGPNTDLRKGPMRGLAKGSIYSQLTASTGSESRGK